MGENATELIWDPLFQGRLGKSKEEVTLSWFWARIKKRTFKLANPEGGFKNFAERIASEIKYLGGKICLNEEVSLLKSDERCFIVTIKKNIFLIK